MSYALFPRLLPRPDVAARAAAISPQKSRSTVRSRFFRDFRRAIAKEFLNPTQSAIATAEFAPMWSLPRSDAGPPLRTLAIANASGGIWCFLKQPSRSAVVQSQQRVSAWIFHVYRNTVLRRSLQTYSLFALVFRIEFGGFLRSGPECKGNDAIRAIRDLCLSYARYAVEINASTMLMSM
jgi:hypothetical protein